MESTSSGSKTPLPAKEASFGQASKYDDVVADPKRYSCELRTFKFLQTLKDERWKEVTAVF